MLAATGNLLFWRYQEVIGSHFCTTAFELTIFPAAAEVILVALLKRANRAKLTKASSVVIHYLRDFENLAEEELKLAWTLIEVIARLDSAAQPRVTMSRPEKISERNLRAISCVGERARAQSLLECFSLTPKWLSRVVGAFAGIKLDGVGSMHVPVGKRAFLAESLLGGWL